MLLLHGDEVCFDFYEKFAILAGFDLSLACMEIFSLNLLSPLYYVSTEERDPFGFAGNADGTESEKLYCFELDENERNSFEPDKERLLGRLVFGGEAAGDLPGGNEGPREHEGAFELPRGIYLFAQERRILNKKEIISMAAEIQSEGLWQRLKPGKLLYLRFLYEDGSWVTQLLRPKI